LFPAFTPFSADACLACLWWQSYFLWTVFVPSELQIFIFY